MDDFLKNRSSYATRGRSNDPFPEEEDFKGAVEEDDAHFESLGGFMGPEGPTASNPPIARGTTPPGKSSARPTRTPQGGTTSGSPKPEAARIVANEQPNQPKVELLMEGRVVRRIIITQTDGQVLELDCQY